jgi:ribonuclease T2
VRREFLFGAAIVAAAAFAGAASAEVKISGTFVADASCPAMQTIRTAKNPGNVGTVAGKSYEVIAGNRQPPTHYWIRVPGAQPDLRWVEVGCGHLAGGSATAASETRKKPSAGGKPDYILAIGWEPAFCETKPDKTECRNETADGFDAAHLTLHGLWPEPFGRFYCGVSDADKANDTPAHWQDLPAVELDPQTRRELDQAMPGTASMLDRHEWIKHGTCSGLAQQAYFSVALALLEAINGSPVRDLFAKNVGKVVTASQIRGAFDGAFGAGAGDRVRVSCVKDPSNGRRMIEELTLGLAGPIAPENPLASLLMASSPTDAGCPQGLIDRPGRQ